MTRSQRLTFPNAHNQQLAANLDLPKGDPIAYAIFAHCFTCSRNVFAAARISQALTDHGFAVLRFDFTGLGNSQGDFQDTTFSSNIQDLIAASEWLSTHHQAPALLVGHSLGGAAVLAAAHHIPSACAVATIGAPCDPEHVTHLFQEDLDTIESQGFAHIDIAGRTFTIQNQLVQDLRSYNPQHDLPKLNKALLIFHSPQDTVVSINNAKHIYQHARHPKSFVSLDRADHLLTRREDAQYVADVLSSWVRRYIEHPPQPTEAPNHPKTGVLVREAHEGRFTQTVLTPDHTLRADEPLSVGGDNTGPTPYDLLLSALGTCTTMTLRMYAERKKLPIQDLQVHLSHERIKAQDCDDCAETEGTVERIHRTLTIQGDLTDAQRTRLLEIADRCPVHRTLHSPLYVRTSLTNDS